MHYAGLPEPTPAAPGVVPDHYDVTDQGIILARTGLERKLLVSNGKVT